LLRLIAAEGSFFVLDNKEAKNQGLDLMLAMLGETLIASAQAR